jgi:ribosomal protein S12 methylthiotransferase
MRSRTLDSLRAEAEGLAAKGVKELILIAQDSTDYGRDLGDGTDLASLLPILDALPGIEWIRLHYAYPNRITDRLLRAMAGSPKVCRYLDIPLQHADSRILRAMKRGGSGAIFLRMIRKIRRVLPGCALRTTFIAGFPGEDRRAFGELCEFVREAEFDHAGVFTYSHEEGTGACALADSVPVGLKQERRARLMEIQSGVSLRKNRARVGQVLPVRVDGLEADTRMLLVGRTEFQSPDVDGRVLITDGIGAPGLLVPVRVEEAHPYDLVGRIQRS